MKKILLVLTLIVGTLVSKAQINPDLQNKIIKLIKDEDWKIKGLYLSSYTIINLDIKPITEGQFILNDIEFLKNSKDSNTSEIKKQIEQKELDYKYMPSYKKDILIHYKVTLDILGELSEMEKNLLKLKNKKLMGKYYVESPNLNRKFTFTFNPIEDLISTPILIVNN